MPYVASICKRHTYTGCQKRVRQFIPPTPPYFGVKYIQVKTTVAMSGLGAEIASIEGNLGTLMASLCFNDPTGDNQSWIGYGFGTPTDPYTIINDGGWQWIGAQIGCYVDVLPYFGFLGSAGWIAVWTDSAGNYLHTSTTYTDFLNYPFPVGAISYQGFDTQAHALAAMDGATKQLQWAWAYYPQYQPGTVLPLHHFDNRTTVGQFVPGSGFQDNIITTKPEADLHTPTIGSVAKMSPNDCYQGINYGASTHGGITIYMPVFGGYRYIIDGEKPITLSGGAGGTGGGGAGAGGSTDSGL